VEDRFDVVPVRVDDERRVIPGVVLRAKTRRAVVAAAGLDSRAKWSMRGSVIGSELNVRDGEAPQASASG
jgi:hypothetical protein